MPSHEIMRLLAAVRRKYGENKIMPYGTSAEEEHGTGFLVSGVLATFSVHTQEGTLPLDKFDIQIESNPPGDYLYTDVVTLDEFLRLIEKVIGPEDEWPTSSKSGL